MNWTAAAALVLALAVSMGAFGAHALRGRLDTYSTGIYEKAVFYHFVHGLGMLAVSLLPRLSLTTPGGADRVCMLLAVGVLLFSGSLYVMAVTGVRWLGAITPAGGTAFIAAWLLLAWILIRNPAVR